MTSVLSDMGLELTIRSAVEPLRVALSSGIFSIEKLWRENHELRGRLREMEVAARGWRPVADLSPDTDPQQVFLVWNGKDVRRARGVNMKEFVIAPLPGRSGYTGAWTWCWYSVGRKEKEIVGVTHYMEIPAPPVGAATEER